MCAKMSVFVDIEKKLGAFSLKVCCSAENETLALLGASGCGKSMTLKCIAGIETPDKGRIVINGVSVFDSERKINLPPQQRRVGLMFQNYALFPTMTVLQNINAGAKREKNAQKREAAVKRVLAEFDLLELTKRYPHQLSGGQQQRVALARILVSDPQILLLDEPFSALDSHLRFRLEQELRTVIKSFGQTVLLVSHDRDEVYRLADRIAVMKDGEIEVCGEKKAVFAAPGTRTGAMLTGCKNISRVRKLADRRLYAEDWGMELSTKTDIGMSDYVGIRMHDLRPGEEENAVEFCVVEEIENPFSVTVMLRPVGAEHAGLMGWETDKSTWVQLRANRVKLSLPMEALLLLKENGKLCQ